MTERNLITLNPLLNTSKLVLAMAQLRGPFPDGKHLSVINGRETFAWKTLVDMTSRTEKACAILKFLHDNHPETNIAIFPEYSLPLPYAIPDLHKCSQEYQIVIIAGADNIHQPNGSVLNQGAILIPSIADPVWVTKRELSQWEQTYLDQPPNPAMPLLIWSAPGHEFWISVNICFDIFNLVGHELQSHKNAGLFIIPMCSPDITTLRTYADVLLRSDSGRAVILCNSVDDFAVGGSCVMAVAPNAGRLIPAFEIADRKEAIAVFEIHCDHLAARRKTSLTAKGPIGKHLIYDVDSGPEGLKITPSVQTHDAVSVRGVINPALFALCGKIMRLAFLEVESYGELAPKVRNKDFEVLVILGQHDVLITHVHQDAYAMIYDVSQAIPWKSSGSRQADRPAEPEEFPYFEVEKYFKVLGTLVDQEARAVFSDPEQPVPTEEELRHILALSEDWDASGISEDERHKFLERKWILSSTAKLPGQVSAIMTVSMDYAGGEITEPLDRFEALVLPRILAKAEVTSLYRGTGKRFLIHYIIRVTSSIDSLFALIDELHLLAGQAKVLITTSTYVVIRKLADLGLRRACLMPELPPKLAYYRDTHILTTLTAEERIKFVSLAQDEQQRLISFCQRLDSALMKLIDRAWMTSQYTEIQRRLVRGLLNKDLSIMKDPHDTLQGHVESALNALLDQSVAAADLDLWRSSLNIPPGKTMDTLTYTERIRLVSKAVDEQRIMVDLKNDMNNLNTTTAIRNAFAHGDIQRVTVDGYVSAIELYCDFLSRRERGEK